jgi:hypothetical protein
MTRAWTCLLGEVPRTLARPRQWRMISQRSGSVSRGKVTKKVTDGWQRDMMAPVSTSYSPYQSATASICSSVKAWAAMAMI